MTKTYYRLHAENRHKWKILVEEGSDLKPLKMDANLYESFDQILDLAKPGEIALLYYDDNRYALYEKRLDGNLHLLSGDVLFFDAALASKKDSLQQGDF